MAVIDSSVLIPLSRTGEIELLYDVFDHCRTLNEVYRETVEEGEGREGTSRIKEAFQNWLTSEELEDGASEIAALEGITETDAALILLAEKRGEVLVTNDRAMVKVAEARGVETYWLTTVVLKAVKTGVLNSEEGKDLLYDLVDAGMNLDNKAYSRLLKEMDDMNQT